MGVIGKSRKACGERGGCIKHRQSWRGCRKLRREDATASPVPFFLPSNPNPTKRAKIAALNAKIVECVSI